MLDQISPEELGEQAHQEWNKMGLRLADLVIAKARELEQADTSDLTVTRPLPHPDTPHWKPTEVLREIGFED